MNTLPEPHKPQHFAQAGQIVPGWGEPTLSPQDGYVELYGERPRIKYVPDAYGRMVPMVIDQVPPLPERTAPRDLSPLPLIDYKAQRMVGAGIGTGAAAAGIGYGAGQFLSGLAAAGTGVLFWVAVMILVARMPLSRAMRGGPTYVTNNHNRGFARSITKNG